HYVQLGSAGYFGRGVGELKWEGTSNWNRNQMQMEVEDVLPTVSAIGREQVDRSRARGLAHSGQNPTCCSKGTRSQLLRNVEEVLVMPFRENEDVPRIQWLNIEKGDHFLVFVDDAHHLVSPDNPAEDTGWILVRVHPSSMMGLFARSH